MKEYQNSLRLFNSTDSWIKFTGYEIIEFNNELYICPAGNASMEVYNLEDKFPLIIKDFLVMGQSMERNFNDLNSQAKAIIKFANKYGLLGLFYFWASEFINDFEEGKSYTKAVILAQYNPFKEVLGKMYNSGSKFCLEWEYTHYASLFFPKLSDPYPDIYSEKNLFWKDYSEPVYAYRDLVLLSLNSIYLSAIDLSEFDSGRYSYDDLYCHDKHWRGKHYKNPDDDDVLLTWKEFLTTTIRIEDIDIRIRLEDGERSIKYLTKNSLYKELHLRFIQDVVSNKQIIKKCQNPRCGDWFIAKSPKALYCKASCGTCVRVNRFRKKDSKD